MNRQTLLIVLVAAVAAFAGALASMFLLAPEEPPQFTAGTLLSEPRPLPDFTLVRHDGAAFTRKDFENRWTLVFYGFTHCPDVCPNTLFMLDRVVDKLAQQERQLPEVLFVSVDPERDSPEQIAEYVNYFNPAFTGATGDGDNLGTITRAMSVAYEFQPHGDSYDVIHSSAVLLVDPQARLHALFTPPLAAEAISSDLRQLLPAAR